MWNDEIIKKATEDQRLTVSHMALFFAVIVLCRRQNGYKTIQTSRKVLMGKSHISSLQTYHKCINELVFLQKNQLHPIISSKNRE
jgi:ribosomal protein L19